MSVPRLAEETVLRVELPDLEGNRVEVQITEDTASALTDVFVQTWDWGQDGGQAEDLIAAAHRARDSAYPEQMSPEELADALRDALEALLDGEAGEAANDLAAIIDTLEHLGEPEPEVTRSQTLQ